MEDGRNAKTPRRRSAKEEVSRLRRRFVKVFPELKNTGSKRRAWEIIPVLTHNLTFMPLA
jgi:hypothetical protein